MRLAKALALLLMSSCALSAFAAEKVLRYAMTSVPKHLDPARQHDLVDNQVAGTLFDTLYAYDYLARPLRVVPLAAASLPSYSADGREVTIRLRPGIRFSDHPAFGGRAHELEARDVVFSLMRLMDPAVSSPMQVLVDGLIEGLDEAATQARALRRGLDYEKGVSGLVAVDRLTVRIRLKRSEHALAFILANAATSIVPRDVVLLDSEAFARKPTGSGPFELVSIVPAQRLVLKRSASYRGMPWEAIATPGPEHREVAADMRGKKLPAVERVEISLVAEPSAWLLALQSGQFDVVPGTRFALDGGKLREPLARRGIVLSRAIAPITEHLYFNMADPVLGGQAPERVALRRAVAMSFDDDAYIAQFHSGTGFLQPHPVPPGIDGHDASYRNPNAYDPQSANALLDRFGYRRAADGLRTRPDGSPLALTMLRLPQSSGRDQAEFMQRALRRIGVAVAFETLSPSDWIQRLTVCRHQMVISQWVLDFPDGSSALAQFHGRNVGTQNMACFANAQFDELYDRLLVTPFGADRAALYRRLVAVLDAQMPARTLPDSPTSVLASSRVRGLVVHPVYRIVYPYVDLAASRP